jgi:hypothetical protein
VLLSGVALKQWVKRNKHWRKVMERRSLLAGLMVLAISMFLMAGTAFAHKTTKKGKASTEGAESTCVIHSLPSFVAQGEFGEASSVADIVEVECNPEYAGETVKLSDTELFSRCHEKLSWDSPTTPGTFVEGKTTTVTLDDDGNATAAVWGGPGCASGETLMSAHLEHPPFPTVTTNFEVLSPKVTPTAVKATPEAQVEDDTTSSVATIIQVEFPSVFAEQDVNISAEQLFARCGVDPRLTWIGPDENVLGTDVEGISKVKLDNDGNAFVVVIGSSSCASGESEIEASLEGAPFTTLTSDFTVLAPEVTAF